MYANQKADSQHINPALFYPISSYGFVLRELAMQISDLAKHRGAHTRPGGDGPTRAPHVVHALGSGQHPNETQG